MGEREVDQVCVALRALLEHTEFYVHGYHPNGKRELPSLRRQARLALEVLDLSRAAAPRDEPGTGGDRDV